LDINDKLKYLKITTQDDLKKLEDMHYHPRSGGCAFYLQSDEYDKCYAFLKQHMIMGSASD
jgi:hypothetical protein